MLWEAFFVSPTSYKIKTYELILAIFKISYVIVDVVAVVVVVVVLSMLLISNTLEIVLFEENLFIILV